jgi:hypothetical protein
MAVTAIPTNYNGTRFRSRLEAKWAAMFDRCSWHWSYEPNDFDGYIPDFLLHFRVPILVEVKPLRWDESDHDEDILQAARTKVVHSGIKGEVLIVGTGIVPDQRIGMLMDINPDTDEATPWHWAFGFRCDHCGNRSFAPECNSWHCRARGCYDERDGRQHLGAWDVDEDFRRASSEVQWRPR